MSTRLKHRLLGLVVILLALAILLPLFFRNSSNDKTKALVTQIPTPPQPLDIRFDEPSKNQVTPLVVQNQALSEVGHSQGGDQGVVAPDVQLQKQVTVPQPPAVAGVAKVSQPVAQQAQQTVKKRVVVIKPTKKNQLSQAPKKKVAVSDGQVKAVKPMAQKTQKHEPPLMGLSTPRAWVIQLASFSEVSNADRLVKRLRDKGYNAYDRETTAPSGQRIVRVFVGPDINLKHMKQTLKQLQTQFGLKGMIKRYQL